MQRSLKLTKTMVIGVWLGLAVWSQTAAQEQTSAITVFVAKKIATMDPTRPTATAVAIRGHEIMSVGSLADLQPWLKAHPHRIDTQFNDK